MNIEHMNLFRFKVCDLKEPLWDEDHRTPDSSLMS